MGDELVNVEIKAERVAVVTLSNPPVNAMSTPARQQLIRAMDVLADDAQVGAIVLTGSGRLFCAGADIKEKAALADKVSGEAAASDRVTRESFFCLLDSGKPVVAAVNGGALGAGFVMAACCDIILAAESAFFAMPEIDVGQGGGASFLQRIMPQQAMRYMLLTAQRVPAQELYRLGAVHECVPDDDLLSRAIELAGVMAGKNPVAVRAIRQSFRPVAELGLRDGFSVEQAYTSALSRSPEAAEARRAFLAGRNARKPEAQQQQPES
jgi:enoyl-CoA hydratase